MSLHHVAILPVIQIFFSVDLNLTVSSVVLFIVHGCRPSVPVCLLIIARNLFSEKARNQTTTYLRLSFWVSCVSFSRLLLKYPTWWFSIFKTFFPDYLTEELSGAGPFRDSRFLSQWLSKFIFIKTAVMNQKCLPYRKVCIKQKENYTCLRRRDYLLNVGFKKLTNRIRMLVLIPDEEDISARSFHCVSRLGYLLRTPAGRRLVRVDNSNNNKGFFMHNHPISSTS